MIDPKTVEEFERANRAEMEAVGLRNALRLERAERASLEAERDALREALKREHSWSAPLHIDHDPAVHIAKGYDKNHCGTCLSISECPTCALLSNSAPLYAVHGYTCGWCEWGRDRTRTKAEYDAHVAETGHTGDFWLHRQAVAGD